MVSISKQQFDEASLLLPWYVTGKLTELEKEQLEKTLQHSPELRQELIQQQQLAQLINEDHEVLDVVAITTQEQRLDNLLERINKQAEREVELKISQDSLASRIKGWFNSLLALPSSGWAQVALALFIVAQVAILTMVFNNTISEKPVGASYVLVTDDVYVPSDKTVLMFHFTAQAKKQDIDQLFAEIGVRFVEHPEGSTHYKVTLADSMDEKELDNLISRLEKKTDLIQLIGKGL